MFIVFQSFFGVVWEAFWKASGTITEGRHLCKSQQNTLQTTNGALRTPGGPEKGE